MTQTFTRRRILTHAVSAAGVAVTLRAAPEAPGVRLERLPDGGIQPQAVVDPQGLLRVLYYSGDAHQGDLFYVQSRFTAEGAAQFSAPIRVNSQEGSAIAAGTIRGGQLAVGRRGRVHVAWNGSQSSEPRGPLNPESGKPGEPMLYARLNSSGNAFEPQRNLMLQSYGLDGGGSIAADTAGNVSVGWHGVAASDRRPAAEGEARRAVWITKSSDDGGSFAPEARAWTSETGACGCCGMKLAAGAPGEVFALYRSAGESIHRDIYLLAWMNPGGDAVGMRLDRWEINACPMSSMDLVAVPGVETVVLRAWETKGQVYWQAARPLEAGYVPPVPAPGEGKGRKHPRLAANRNGDVLFVWTEGTGWQKGGGFAWQLYDKDRRLTGSGERPHDIPVWSFAAPVARPDGGFTILY